MPISFPAFAFTLAKLSAGSQCMNTVVFCRFNRMYLGGVMADNDSDSYEPLHRPRTDDLYSLYDLLPLHDLDLSGKIDS